MKLPNGSSSLPLFQMLHWVANPFTFMEGNAQQYGDYFTTRLGKNFAPVIFISDPQGIQAVLTSDTKEFDTPGEHNYLFEPFFGKHSVIGLSGEAHRRQRQLMMPSFHGERMRSYGQLMSDITRQVIEAWELDQPFDVRSSMQKISLRIILTAVFGLHEGDRYQRLEELLKTLMEEASSPLSVSMLYFPILRQDWGASSPWGRFLRRREQIDQLIYAEIDNRRQNPDSTRTDILSLLMAAQDETGAGMTNVELRDELLTLLFAGHETTATALTWALYWIHKLPDVQEQLVKELDQADRADPSVVLRLPYLNAVCSETLRIYPVAMLTFPRVVRSPVRLLGNDLDPGTTVIGCIYLTHQREDLYPDPKSFKPERFLERQFSPYEYLPFGGGNRRCIGMAFALFEMKVVLAEILSRFELKLADDRPVKPGRRGLVSGPSPVRLKAIAHRTPTAVLPEMISSRTS